MTTKHHHKYRRVNIGRDKEYWVMQCAFDGCTHYVPMKTRLSCPTLVGKMSICNNCTGAFPLDRRALRMSKPICVNCVKTPIKEELNKAEEFFKSLEEGLKP